VLGVLLGPAVLGRLAPDAYDPLFVGSGDTTALTAAEQELDLFLTDSQTRQAQIDKIVKEYALVGSEDDSTTIARDEQIIALNNRFAEQELKLRNNVVVALGQVTIRRNAHLDKLSGMSTTMLLLIVIVLAAEAILSPQRSELEKGQTALPPALSRLITVRYGLAAGWLMLMLAQPTWLRGIAPTFGIILLTVVLVAGLAPLGKKENTVPDTFS